MQQFSTDKLGSAYLQGSSSVLLFLGEGVLAGLPLSWHVKLRRTPHTSQKMDAGPTPRRSACKVRAMHALACDTDAFMRARARARIRASSHAHMYMHTSVARIM
eukprot:6197469-Pleurochrysis_carterae.AAC.2